MFLCPLPKPSCLLLQGRGYWTAVIPTALNETNCLGIKPTCREFYAKTVIVWGVMTLWMRYKLIRTIQAGTAVCRHTCYLCIICKRPEVRPGTQSMAVTFVSHRIVTIVSVAMNVPSSQLMLTCTKYRDINYVLGIVINRIRTPCTSLASNTFRLLSLFQIHADVFDSILRCFVLKCLWSSVCVRARASPEVQQIYVKSHYWWCVYSLISPTLSLSHNTSL
jgi:hypothetical protein